MTSIAGEIFILFERKAFRKGLSKLDKGKEFKEIMVFLHTPVDVSALIRCAVGWHLIILISLTNV